ncbi:LAETG motif-containing sortase-dependent surface protein [Kitasatospora sp. NBC_00458]|uniref:LAETG motif-containing sortase-dependent surface protein n=1 Tax=Kitasatospora sp. NBC_00458 TaxID=2903568 RepID=UPI002E177E70
MRSSRLLAASTLLALSLGTTVGAATAGAVAVSPSPTATPSATATATDSPAPTGTPSATGTPGASASPGETGAPSASASPSPSGTPSATRPPVRPSLPATATPGACRGGVHQADIKVTGNGLWGGTTTPGAVHETTVTWENTSGVELPNFATYLYLTDHIPEGASHPVEWSKDFFSVQFRAPGQDWKSVAIDDRALNTGTYKLGKGEKVTLQFRIAATGKAPIGEFGGNFGGGDTAMDNAVLPHPATADKNACTQYISYYEGTFKLAAPGTATTGTASAAGSTSPSASPSAKASSAPAGPHLAETGSSSTTLPLAVGGAAVLAAGAGTLFVLRRRKAGAHS